MIFMPRLIRVVLLALFCAASALTLAQAGKPVPYQMGFQEPATPIMERIVALHDFLMIVITAITIFVLSLLAWCAYRFRASVNPTPTKTSHNPVLEVAWTIVPCLILIVIAFPSLSLLYAQHNIPKPDLTIKATGNQWYWSYEYTDPEMGGIAFDSFMLEDADRKAGQPRLLAVDTPLVVPVGKNVELLVISNDVLHSWTVASFGVKMDAVPGQLAQTWFRVNKPGIYYGQCSELCGSRHAFMPIEVHAVSEAEFQDWVKKAKEEFAAVPDEGNHLDLAAISPQSIAVK